MEVSVNSKHVVRKTQRLTKDEAKALIATGLQRVASEHGLDKVALEAGCSRRCIEKALAHDTLPEAHTLLNALTLDPTVLHEALLKLGLQVVPLDWAASPDMQTIAKMSETLSLYINALQDGKRDHRETCQIAEHLRPLIAELTAIVREADGLRVAA
jgi:DNA-binding phage protein